LFKDQSHILKGIDHNSEEIEKAISLLSQHKYLTHVFYTLVHNLNSNQEFYNVEASKSDFINGAKEALDLVDQTIASIMEANLKGLSQDATRE